VRNVIVTGGTRGIGLAVADGLASDGYRVLAIARTESAEFAERALMAEAAGAGELHFRAFDLHAIADIAGLFTRLGEEFGPCYGLVNNAGVGTSGVLATMPDREIEALLRLNIASPIAMSKCAVRSMMVAADGGRIVNMSSIVAETGYSGLSVYSASKAALSGFTRSLAREVGPLGITVNGVAPGFIATELTREMTEAHRDSIARRSALRRLAEPQDVAGAVRYFMSDAARNVTGTILTVDAGNTA
jgi:3-oxoacyl-[acyl-carrier protein] reductase